MEKIFWREIDRDLVYESQYFLAKWLSVRLVEITFPGIGIGDYSIGVNLVPYKTLLDWNVLSRMGILVALNKVVFYPRGYIISVNTYNGFSPYLLRPENEALKYTNNELKDAIIQLKYNNINIEELTNK